MFILNLFNFNNIFNLVYSHHPEDSFMLNSIPSIVMVVINYGNDTG